MLHFRVSARFFSNVTRHSFITHKDPLLFSVDKCFYWRSDHKDAFLKPSHPKVVSSAVLQGSFWMHRAEHCSAWGVAGTYLDLQGEVCADGVQQQFGRFLPAHQHQFQVHVPFDQQAFGHQTDTCHPAQHRRAVGPEGRWKTASVRVCQSHTEVITHKYSFLLSSHCGEK